MKTDKLNNADIYAIPVGQKWNVEDDRIQLLYAPLNGRIALASAKDVVNMEACAEGLTDKSSIHHVLSAFQAQGNVPVHHIPKTPHELYQIDILTNFTCNFKCIYCYSAAGRSSQQIEFCQIKAVIDYLFCSGKKQENPYIINFSGGGEPLMSYDLIRRTVNYIEEVNRGKEYKYNIGLVTNGSLITPEIIDFLQSKGVNMAVSFEILQRLQDKERGSYGRVAENIDMMLEKGYSFGIRTTFTPESVSCMCEMVEEVAHRFPKLKKVVFDVVLSPDLFPTPESLKTYYDTFLNGFYKAKKLALQYDIVLESIAVELLSMVRDRTCEGKIVLTPMGVVSSCARISSPREKHYDKYIYGIIQEGQLVFDQERFASIMNECNIYSQPMCHNCFARWNCGGGCRLFHHSFPPEFETVRCDFVRQALKRQLLQVMERNNEQSTGKSLESIITQKIQNKEL